LAAAGGPFAYEWVQYRRSHSITDDAFVEAHIVNIAPQSVSGHIVRFLVDENDRVAQGQVVAEIDPVPYRDQVAVARAKLASAQAHVKLSEAKLAKALAEERKIEVSTRDVEVAHTVVEKAGKNVEIAETGHDQIREVELLTVVKMKTVEEARRGLVSAENMLSYTQIRAPFPGVVVKRYRH